MLCFGQVERGVQHDEGISRIGRRAELVSRRSPSSADAAQTQMATLEVAIGDLDGVGRLGRHAVEPEAALDLGLRVLVEGHSAGEGAGGHARSDASIGLMIPTSRPFGSATIA